MTKNIDGRDDTIRVVTHLHLYAAPVEVQVFSNQAEKWVGAYCGSLQGAEQYLGRYYPGTTLADVQHVKCRGSS